MSTSRHRIDPTIAIRSYGLTFRGGQMVPPPCPGWHQLLYAIRGVLTVRTNECVWVVPPHRAVWVPDGVHPRVEMNGPVALRSLYVASRRVTRTRECAVVNVTPLLREMILRTVQLGALDVTVPAQKRLAGVILDELKLLRGVPLQLPLPHDVRAMKFVAALGRELGTETTPRPALSQTLRACGLSRRTMERVFQHQTGMSFGQWLRREKLLRGLRRLAAGEAVKTVAVDLGYGSASAFIAMFRRELGQTPGRYFEANMLQS